MRIAGSVGGRTDRPPQGIHSRRGILSLFRCAKVHLVSVNLMEDSSPVNWYRMDFGRLCLTERELLTQMTWQTQRVGKSPIYAKTRLMPILSRVVNRQ
jgi:hypothetical protein